jgi:hypothetical protein
LVKLEAWSPKWLKLHAQSVNTWSSCSSWELRYAWIKRVIIWSMDEFDVEAYVSQLASVHLKFWTVHTTDIMRCKISHNAFSRVFWLFFFGLEDEIPWRVCELHWEKKTEVAQVYSNHLARYTPDTESVACVRYALHWSRRISRYGYLWIIFCRKLWI